MIFSTIVSALNFFEKKILPFGMNVILQTSIITTTTTTEQLNEMNV
jgi:hypothetical protein